MRVEGLGSVVRSKPRGVDGAEESPDGILWSSTFGTLVGAEELLKATAVECERGVLPAELGARIERVAAVVWCDPCGVDEAEDIPDDSAWWRRGGGCTGFGLSSVGPSSVGPSSVGCMPCAAAAPALRPLHSSLPAHQSIQ